MNRPFLHSLLFLLLWASIPSADAQISQFQFDPSKVPVGTVLHYAKSNMDGSRATRISVYFKDREQIQSFKWDRGQTSATLVQAHMDWSRFSVRELRSWSFAKGKPPQLKGTLQVSDDGIPFRQRESATNEAFEGLQSQVVSMGGTLTMHSGESGGVEVLLSLPWPRREGAAPGDGPD